MVLREYRKTATIKAERFDGSFEMMKRYSINKAERIFSSAAKRKYMLPTLEGVMAITMGDYIATGVNGEHWAIKKEIFEKTYELVED